MTAIEPKIVTKTELQALRKRMETPSGKPLCGGPDAWPAVGDADKTHRKALAGVLKSVRLYVVLFRGALDRWPARHRVGLAVVSIGLLATCFVCERLAPDLYRPGGWNAFGALIMASYLMLVLFNENARRNMFLGHLR